MATNFPSGLDALTNPTGSSSLTSPDHASQHADANDAIEALQTKVGVDGSAVTSTIDYKVAASKTVTDKIDPAGASTNQVLKYNGTKFVPSTGASVTISDTPPTSPTPQAGDQWYESDTGRTLIYYDNAWVETGSVATTNVNANDLSGTTLASNVVTSSLTTVGTITNLQATAATINGWTVSQPGLVLVKTQTVGTGVSSVTVSDAFSSTYDNYEIIYTGGALSNTADAQLVVQLGSASTNYRTSLLYVLNNTTPLAATNNSTGAFLWCGGGSANDAYAHFWLFNPYLTRHTRFETPAYQPWNDAGFGHAWGVHSSATSFTAFTLSTTAGTLTGGTIRVYGYRNS